MHLLDFPSEILNSVATFLPLEDLSSLRQTCETAGAKTFYAFARDYFWTKRIFLELRNLEILGNISRHPKLGPSVRTLEICIYDCVSHTSAFTDISSRGFDFDAYCQYEKDRRELTRSNSDLEHLTNAMRLLSNCTKIVIDNAHVPWGWSQLLEKLRIPKETDMTIDVIPGKPLFDRVLNTALVAVATSRLSVEELDICPRFLGPKNCKIPVSPDFLVLRKSPENGAFSSLRTLRLELCDCNHHLLEINWASELQEFLAHFPMLSHFRLHFDNSNPLLQDPLLESEAEFGSLARLLLGLNLPHLRHLELCDMTIPEGALRMVLEFYGKVVQIKLECIHLKGFGRWSRLLGEVQDQVQGLEMRNCSTSDCLAKLSLFVPKVRTIAEMQGYISMISSIETDEAK
ncbi:hypothetical protein EDB80DRAFT_733881 [Ilyonectria destructans]|nr:hypothetical protein EDB80DRAFT_733881 [Ilyonectria destructans]